MATPRGGFPSPGRMQSKRRTASGSQKPGPSFSWFVEQEFSPWSAQTHRSPNTHKRYAVSAKSLVGFCGNFPLPDLTPGMVERYKLWRIGQCGPTGVNRDLAALRFMRDVGVLILGTGMRPAEVLSLKCDDIHLAEQYALVPKGKTVRPGEPCL